MVGSEARVNRVSDYEDAQGREISTSKGPIAVCCGKPYKECRCERPLDTPGTNMQMESPGSRQATALEKIAAYLEVAVVKLEHLSKLLAESKTVPAIEPTNIAAPMIEIPGVTAPLIDAAAIAANEAKKAELINRTKGLKWMSEILEAFLEAEGLEMVLRRGQDKGTQMRRIRFIKDWGCYSAGMVCAEAGPLSLTPHLVDQGIAEWVEEEPPSYRLDRIESELDQILQVLQRSE